MAEFLVRAVGHYLDDVDPNTLPEHKREQWYARTQKGDVFCVRPDGWTWGTKECLPGWIVLKVPGLSVETVKHMEEQLWDRTNPDAPKLLKRKKWIVPANIMNNLLNQNQSVITVNKTAVIDKITAKVS